MDVHGRVMSQRNWEAWVKGQEREQKGQSSGKKGAAKMKGQDDLLAAAKLRNPSGGVIGLVAV